MPGHNEKPNILLVFIDSMRADHVSCYGYHRETTPNIDRIAAEGCLFENAFTAAPFSPASYASVFSGLYPHQHGVNGDDKCRWPDTWTSLPEKLVKCGYYTFCLSNNSFVSEWTAANRGFHAFYGPRDSWLVRQHGRARRLAGKAFGKGAEWALDWNWAACRRKGSSSRAVGLAVDEISKCADQPFFGVLILMDPHTPYDRRYQSLVDDRARARHFLHNVNHRMMWSKLMASGQSLTPYELQGALEVYDSHIRHADDCVGQLVATLAHTGKLDSTVLLVASDHGEAFGEDNVWGHGFSLDDALICVPLVARYPALWPVETKVDDLIQLHDVHDMCLTLVAPDANTSPLIRVPGSASSNDSGRECVYSHFPIQRGALSFFTNLNATFEPGHWAGDLLAVRTRDWKMTRGSTGWERIEKIDEQAQAQHLEHDPPEHVRADLRAQLDRHLSNAGSEDNLQPLACEPEGEAEVLDRLRDLGYVE